MSAIDFDPHKHRIVAVDVDPESPERGNHFHLSLPDLVREAAELPAIDWSPLERKIAALEAELSALKSFRAPVPLIAQTMPEVEGRIAALESYAAAQSELGTALSSVLMLVHEMGAKTQVLEKEARETRRVVEIVAPALAAIGKR